MLLVGVAVAIVSSAIQSLGLVLQRYSHVITRPELHEQEPQLPEEPSLATIRKSARLWMLGVALFIGGNIIGSAVQLATLPLVILCPLQAAGLVFNVLFACQFLGEQFTRAAALGTLLVAAGAAIVAGPGAVIPPTLTLSDMLAAFARPLFATFATCSLVFAVVLALLALRKRCCWLLPTRGMALACSAGVFSALALLLAKDMADLAMEAAHGRYEANLAAAIVGFAITFLILAGSQLFLSSRGLKWCSTSLLYPIQFCVYNAVSLVNGLAYYDARSNATKSKILFIALGTLVLLAGVGVLSAAHLESREELSTIDTDHEMIFANEPYHDVPPALLPALDDAGNNSNDDRDTREEYTSLDDLLNNSGGGSGGGVGGVGGGNDLKILPPRRGSRFMVANATSTPTRGRRVATEPLIVAPLVLPARHKRKLSLSQMQNLAELQWRPDEPSEPGRD